MFDYHLQKDQWLVAIKLACLHTFLTGLAQSKVAQSPENVMQGLNVILAFRSVVVQSKGVQDVTDDTLI